MTSKSEKKISKNYAKNFSLTSLGWELALPIFFGVSIGHQIDRNLINSGYTFTFLLLILGIFIGYFNLYKLIELEVLRTKVKKNKLEEQRKN